MNRLPNALLAFALPAAAAALLAAAPAQAGAPQTDAPSIVVHFDDLRVDNPGAAGVLERRIERAATDVCGGQPDARDLDRLGAFQRCRDEAIDRAVSQLRLAGVLPPVGGAGVTPLARR